jgi:hypothetical protein
MSVISFLLIDWIMYMVYLSFYRTLKDSK